MQLLKTLDGTGRPPRSNQVHTLTTLDKNWCKYDLFAINAAPGIGKTFICKTIQRATGAPVITLNNNLIKQFTDEYKDTNKLIGAKHYENYRSYKDSVTSCLSGDHTIFNLYSYFYFKQMYGTQIECDTIIIDEAHRLREQLQEISSTRLPLKRYGEPKSLEHFNLIEWLTETEIKLKKLLDKQKEFKKKWQLSDELNNILIVKDLLLHDWAFMSVKIETIRFRGKPTKSLVIKSLRSPIGFFKRLFNNLKVVLLSGTLPDMVVNQLSRKKCLKITIENECPLENQPIYYQPVDETERRDVKKLAEECARVYEEEGNPNTLIHLTYKDVDEFKKHFPYKCLTHTSKNRGKVLDKFKEHGGVLLGCGMSEGVDLPDHECRLVLVPNLFYGSLGDQGVLKRKAHFDGKKQYLLDTMITLQQQIKRGLRSSTDTCKAYIFDPTFSYIFSETKTQVSQKFTDSVVWTLEGDCNDRT